MIKTRLFTYFLLLFTIPCAAQKLASGSYHGMYICNGGSINTWGSNITGQLGDSTTTDRKLPVYVNGISNVTALSGGGQYTLALSADKKVWSWGGNSSGQLGDSAIGDRYVPQIINSLPDVTALAAGTNYALVLAADSTVWGWGSNGNGNLGDSSNTDRLKAVQARIHSVTQISAGVGHALALKSDSTVWAWGANISGKLGDGTTTLRTTPVQVLNLTGMIAVAAGKFHHSLALKSDGTVWAWGENERGQLGDSSTTDSSIPVMVKGLSDVVAIGTGYMHSLALKSDGTLWAWGSNEFGQIGDSSYADRWVPVQVLTNVQSIAAGAYYHSLVEKTDGSVWAWGYNVRGVLGNGTTSAKIVPTQVTGLCLLTGIETVENPSALSVFPNPCTTTLHIAGVATASCKLYDMVGRMVLETKNQSATYGNTDLYIGQLANGWYMLEVNTGKEVLYRKVLKN